jgi:hypothetical protein
LKLGLESGFERLNSGYKRQLRRPSTVISQFEHCDLAFIFRTILFDEICAYQIIEHFSGTNYDAPHRAAIRATHRDMFRVFMRGAPQNGDIAILRN